LPVIDDVRLSRRPSSPTGSSGGLGDRPRCCEQLGALLGGGHPAERGKPTTIVSDNGPEFASIAMAGWAYRSNVGWQFIRPGKPVENAYIESFNGKFRDECLKQHVFTSLEDARAVTQAWRQDYNQNRPHSALNLSSPAEFAAKLKQGDTPIPARLLKMLARFRVSRHLLRPKRKARRDFRHDGLQRVRKNPIEVR
jgi:hypothetical protein